VKRPEKKRLASKKQLHDVSNVRGKTNTWSEAEGGETWRNNMEEKHHFTRGKDQKRRFLLQDAGVTDTEENRICPHDDRTCPKLERKSKGSTPSFSIIEGRGYGHSGEAWWLSWKPPGRASSGGRQMAGASHV